MTLKNSALITQDGEGNIHLSDSFAGIPLSLRDIKGDLIGKGKKVGGDFYGNGITIYGGNEEGFAQGRADLSEMDFAGTVYIHGVEAGKVLLAKTRMRGDADCHGMRVEHLDMSETYVGGMGLFYDMQAAHASFIKAEIENSADFQRAHLQRFDVQGLEVKGVLRLEDAVIDLCEGTAGLVVGAYSLNERTKIPADLKRALQRYKRVDTYTVH